MSTPPSRVPSTGWLLWQVSLRWRASFDKALAPLGITSAQYGLLASLKGLSRGDHHPSQRELADFAGLEPMQVSKLANTLEKSGMLERTTSPSDSRALQLTLTELGSQTIGRGRRIVLEHENRSLAALAETGTAAVGELQQHLFTLLNYFQGEPES